MERIDRRHFLALGAKTTATAGTLALVGVADGSSPAVAAGRTGTSSSPQLPIGLTTTGTAQPVGVDPDDVQFAWRLADHRRAARPEGLPHRGHRSREWIAARPRSSGSRGRSPRRSRPSSPTPGPNLAAATSYRWTVRTADAAGNWGASERAGHLHHRVCAPATGQRPLAAARPVRPR